MYRSLLSVGGFTLLSRVTGLLREVIMASVLGRGMLSDAFLVAFRLPNHFRTIFAEGAYSAALIPLYSSLKHDSEASSRTFVRTMLGWQIVVQLVLLMVAFFAMPVIVAVLAPGFVARPEQMALAVELTRITFAYLLCVSIVTHLGNVLNAEKNFWPAAAAPILLNLAMAGMLSLAFFFPSAAHAAAWGVFAGGFLEVLLLIGATMLRKLPLLPSWPKLTGDVRQFAWRFGPAALGAAGVQIALFADTILASFLAEGELTSLYYADRINQLPMGIVGVALGTVLLPELSRAVAQGNDIQARRSFNRATEIGLLLALPCLAAFVVFPDAIMQGLFARGAFSVADANAASAVLSAYAAGLPAFILLRTVTPIFHARGDTRTPVYATAVSIGVNIAVKLVLILGLSWGATGLALGTVVGSWVNLGVLAVIASSRGLLKFDERMVSGFPRIVGAAVYCALIAWLIAGPMNIEMSEVSYLRAEMYLAALGLITLVSYGVALLALGWKRARQ